MKFLNALLFFSFLCCYSFGQNVKYFLNDESEICDSAKASTYMIVFEKKLSDSVFRMNQFSKEGILLTIASFKDANLSISHGDFEYYKMIENPPPASINDAPQTTHWQNYLQIKGSYFLNKKNGIWREYGTNGKVTKIVTYIDDVLNGTYTDYDTTGNVITNGEYVNNFQEGRWTMLSGIRDDIYKNGKVIKTIKNKEVIAAKERKQKEELLLEKEKHKYDIPPRMPVDFNFAISKFVNNARSSDFTPETFVVTFTVNIDGTISTPSVTGISDYIMREKIKDYFQQSKGWKPATIGKDKKPVDSWYSYRLISR